MIPVVLLLSGCAREDGDAASNRLPAVTEPNSFAQFVNPLASLPAGSYTVVAATDSVGEAGDFTVTVVFDSGEMQSYEGAWSSSSGPNAGAGNPEFEVTLHVAGGIDITLTSTVDNRLLLLDRNRAVIAENDHASGDSHIEIATSRIDSEAYGAAYYEAIDPTGIKTTLEDWKQSNGYYEARNAGKVINARFRDTKDLGYGRGVRVWTSSNGFFAFVENFQLRSVPGLEYTSLNLDALIHDSRQHHFGSNAIEFSTWPYGPGEPGDIGSTHKFAKFYTFDATQGSQVKQDHASEVRLNRVNLDGRGDRAMPGACVYCHGGTLRPLRADGSFRDHLRNGHDGDTGAKLQVLEVPTFEYWDASPYTQAEQEVFIKQINQAVYCSFPNAAPPAFCSDFTVPPAGAGEWTGDFARELLSGWYNDPDAGGSNDGFGTTNQDFDSAYFRVDFVPSGWRHDPADNMPPAGSEQLFTEVVSTNCIVCHARRGTTLGTNTASEGSKDIDFSTYEKFISHGEQIESYVFERGVMPLSLRGFDAFWNSAAPEILATHLDDFSLLDDEEGVVRPGRPVADAGPDRTVSSPVRMFGGNSRFVTAYGWQILSTPEGGSDARLSDIATPGALLTATQPGEYRIRLTVSNGIGQGDSDTVTITIDSNSDQGAITFENDIKPVLQSEPPGPDCDSCHQQSGTDAVPGVPVYWTDVQPVGGTTLYEEVLARVDFNDPENSLLLTKPSGNHHYGSLRAGFEVDNPSNRFNYDLFLNWILEGAREN